MNGTGHNNGRIRRNDVKRGLRNGVAPYIPAAFAGMPSSGHGATEAARQRRRDRNGRCKPGFCVRDGSRGGDSSAGSVHDSPPRRGRPEKA
ncbi:hypothetical protein ECZU43_54490 [Escherichia coli]|nr:hypothetical protein ECZU43_54490 [Escherichia coli]